MNTTNIKRYRVKSGWIFNLEAMHDKLFCIGYDIDDGKIATPIEILGVTINDSSDLQQLIDEASDLEWKAKGNGLTSKEYGRAKEMVEWRVNLRYNACLASGMSESKAGLCYEDL